MNLTDFLSRLDENLKKKSRQILNISDSHVKMILVYNFIVTIEQKFQLSDSMFLSRRRLSIFFQADFIIIIIIIIVIGKEKHIHLFFFYLIIQNHDEADSL